MNVQRFRKLCNCKYLFNAQKYRSAHQYKTESEIEPLPIEEARVSQIGNGIKVASVEDNGPLTQVSVIIKAGTRYEDPKKNLGIVHCLRNASVLSTKNHSSFSLCRNVEIRGGKLFASATRDHLLYTLKCSRDEVDPCLEVLSEVVTQQLFKPWELADIYPKMEVDVAMFKHNPAAVLNELVHKAAFRGGYSNSLFTPDWMMGKHNSEMLHHYVEDNFITSKTSIVALGIPHDHLQTCVNDLFHMSDKTASTNLGGSKFVPGEVRQEADLDQVHVAIVAEGVGYLNGKDAICLGLLECILGTESDIHMQPTVFTKLGAAAAKSCNDPFYVSTLNLKYADTGLFGVYVVGSPDSMNDLVKAVVAEMKQASKNISEADVEKAKHKYKGKILMERELSDNLLGIMAIETSEFGQIRNVDEILKFVDSLKASDVQSVAGRVVKARPAMAALGRLHSTPHVDELMQ